ELLPGSAWLAPGGQHMVLSRKLATVRLHLNQDPPVNSCRPSVDVLFESVAATYRQRVLAVVLTGMGEDGLRGATALSEAGAHIVVQDEASSVVWGMAGAIAKAGISKDVLPLSEIAGEVTRRVYFGR
ncbi:chemotaxis protein CheB, partial [Candidatus Poribacteria bacterium]|nr:chemotaxis protein CheB [Candidatus Poribacteria bacterium]